MFAGFAFVACESGTTDPPTVEELEENSQLVNFQLPDGRALLCLYYGSEGDGYQTSYSWLILDCDWESLH